MVLLSVASLTFVCRTSDQGIGFIDLGNSTAPGISISPIPNMVDDAWIVGLTTAQISVSSEVVFLLSMSFVPKKWGSATLYVANPSSGKVKIAAELTAPEGYSFDLAGGLAFDKSHNLLWCSLSVRSETGSTLATINPLTGSVFVPRPAVRGMWPTKLILALDHLQL